MLAVGRQFTVQNPSELYVLVSSALPTTRRDIDLYSVESDVKPQINKQTNNKLKHFGSLDLMSVFVKFLVEAQSVILNNSS